MRYVVPRRYRRVPLEARIYLRPAGSDRELSELSYDLSLGGIFVQTRESVPVGSTVAFELDLGETERIEGTGEVVWRRGSSNGSGDGEGGGSPPGLGIRFRDLAPGGRERIFQVVERQAGHAGLLPELRGLRGIVATPPVPGRPTPQVDSAADGAEAGGGWGGVAAPDARSGPVTPASVRPDNGAGSTGFPVEPGVDPPPAGPTEVAAGGLAEPLAREDGPSPSPVQGGTSREPDDEAAPSGPPLEIGEADPLEDWADHREGRPYYADYDVDHPTHRGRWRPLLLLALALVAALAAGGYFYRQEIQAWMDGGATTVDEGQAASGEPSGERASDEGAQAAQAEIPRLQNLLDPEAGEDGGEPAAGGVAVAAATDSASGSEDEEETGVPSLAAGPSPGGSAENGAPGLSSSPIPGPSRLTAVQRISWRSVGAGTEVVIEGDGPIRPTGYSSFRMDGAQPREVIRLQGIRRPYESGRLEVGTAELLAVRSGHHPDVNELHVVLDLADPGVEAEVTSDDGRLAILLRRP